MARGRRWLSRPLVIGVLVAAVAGVGLALYWFQPWKLWQDETVRGSTARGRDPGLDGASGRSAVRVAVAAAAAPAPDTGGR